MIPVIGAKCIMIPQLTLAMCHLIHFWANMQKKRAKISMGSGSLANGVEAFKDKRMGSCGFPPKEQMAPRIMRVQL